MQQHPIPQNVSQYQFKLIGFLTLSQFAFLGGFLLLAFIVFKAPLPFIFTWPVSFILALGGILFTFFKYNERPFHIYVINFLKSVYGPTQYLWQKQEKIPDFFTFTRKTTNQDHSSNRSAVSQQKLQSYLSTLNPKPQIKPQDKIEIQNLSKINQLFGSVKISPQTQPDQNPMPAGDKPRVIKKIPDQKTIETILFQNQIKLSQKNLKVKSDEQKKQISKELLSAKPKPAIQALQSPKPVTLPPKLVPINKNQVSQQIQKTSMNKTNKAQQSIIKPAPSLAPPVQVTSLYPENSNSKPLITPQFLSDVNMPISPEAPNIIVGMTVSKTEKLIPNTIVEIQNSNNMPVRAVKSNRLAQFFIATPIKNGVYQVKAEHSSYKFDTIKIEAKGVIIPPIKIIATT
jgi:PrgI family protein